MGKEKIKTVLLTVLILSSVFFTMQIWTSEKLWPSGYDFFSVLRESAVGRFFGMSSEDKSVNITVTGALDSVFAPGTVMLSYSNGNRITLDYTRKELKDITGFLNDAISGCADFEPIKITEAEWQGALQSGSIYADYTVPIGYSEIHRFLGSAEPKTGSLRAFDKIIIAPVQSVTGIMAVYFRDSENETFYKVSSEFDSNIFTNILMKYSSLPMPDMSYAFEMGLDKKLTGEGESHQKIIIDSYVLIPLNPFRMTVINPSVMDIEENSINHLLSCFEFNPKTARRFTLTNDSIMYVNERSTLSIRKDGYFEYSAADTTKGVKMSDGVSLSDSAASCAKLIDEILSEFDISPSTKLFISSPLVESGGNTHTFKFDYLYETETISMPGNACSAVVTDGYLTSLKAYIRSFEKNSEGEYTDPYNALDRLYTASGSEELVIDEFYRGYIYDEESMTLKWMAKVNGTNEVMVLE